jgi:hypothetical protein
VLAVVDLDNVGGRSVGNGHWVVLSIEARSSGTMSISEPAVWTAGEAIESDAVIPGGKTSVLSAS